MSTTVQSMDSVKLKRKNSSVSTVSSTTSSTNNSRATSINRDSRFGYKGPVVDLMNKSVSNTLQPIVSDIPTKRRRTRHSIQHNENIDTSNSNDVNVQSTNNSTSKTQFHIPDPIVQSMIHELFTDEFNDELIRAQKLKITAAKFAYKELTAQQAAHITTLKNILKQLQHKHTLLIDGTLTVESNLIHEINNNINKAQNTADQVNGLIEQINYANKTILQLKSDKSLVESALHILQQQHSAVSVTIDNKQAEIDMIEQQLAVIRADSELLISKLDEKESEVELHKATITSLEHDYQSLVAELSDTQTDKLDVNKQLESTQLQLQHTNDELHRSTNSHNELQAQYNTLHTEFSKLKSSHTQLQLQLSDVQNELTQLTDKYNSTLASNRQYELDIKQLNQSIEHMKSVHQSELTRYNEKLESNQQNIQLKVQYEIQSKLDQIDSLQRERDLIKHSYDEMKSSVDSIKLDNTTLHKEISRYEQQLISYDSDKQVLQRQLAVMETTLENKQNELKHVLTTFDRSTNMAESNAVAVRQEKQLLEQKYDTVNNAKYELEKQSRELNELNNSIRHELSQANESIDKLKSTELSLTQLLDEQKSKFLIQEQLLKDQLNVLQTTTQSTIESLQSCNQKLQLQYDTATEQITTLTAELCNFKKHCNVSNEQQLNEMVRVSMEVDRLRHQLGDQANLSDKLNECEIKLKQTLDKLATVERDRRLLHNQVQELRGNVRVMIRIRPMGSNDSDQSAAAAAVQSSCVDTFSDGKRLKITTDKNDVKTFGFDNVFSQSTTQLEIFDEVSQLIQSALDGYNVCLFSYGQTGSGKTYTMQGTSAGESRGIIPRSVELIIERVHELRSEGWLYDIEASMLEIYNENVRDLLGKHSLADTDNQHENLEIKRDPVTNASLVQHLTKISISSVQDVATLITMANKQRATAKTDMNERSSRSHSVFTLYLVGHNSQLNLKVNSTLNLVDLAGSERLSRTGTGNDSTRLKETQSINKSLSALADIFNAIQQHNKHIPFRNSKLTYLLEPCFSGDGKTLMIVNLSPTIASSNESLCSLRFASQVNQCELGKPSKNKKLLNSNTSTATSEYSDDTDMNHDLPPVLSRPNSSSTQAPSSAKKLASKSSSASSTSRIAQLSGRK